MLKVPTSFTDQQLVNALVLLPSDGCDADVCCEKYLLTCGLMIRLRTGLLRIKKRTVWKPSQRHGGDAENFFRLLRTFVVNPESTLRSYHDDCELLWRIAEELSMKATNLSRDLSIQLIAHPLVVQLAMPLHHEVRKMYRIAFEKGFLLRVKSYHDSLQRPSGTFDVVTDIVPSSGATEKMNNGNISLLQKLAAMPREICYGCNGKRQVYCGECGGRRMPLAGEFLPESVELPFDVLLFLHWRESLHHCTGIHAAVLCSPGSVSCARWEKVTTSTNQNISMIQSSENCQTIERTDAPMDYSAVDESASVCEEMLQLANALNIVDEVAAPVESTKAADHAPLGMIKAEHGWREVVANLSADRDVLLFPADDAILTSDFEWNTNTKELQDCAQQHRWRLVVLEASWTYGATMAKQLAEYRAALGLPPLKQVTLSSDITGQYWKFQKVGQSAVSTIEAITYAAQDAGLADDAAQTLLLLFHLQKMRVMKNIDQGAKTPKAMEVRGVGVGSWHTLTDALSITSTHPPSSLVTHFIDYTSEEIASIIGSKCMTPGAETSTMLFDSSYH